MIAHQTVEAIKTLSHIRCAGRHINPSRRSKAEHCRYALSTTVNSRSRVTASNPRRTSIRRPLRNSTSNAPPVSAPRLDPSGDREHSCTGIMGTALESKPACRRRRYLSNAVTDKCRWLQKACRVNTLASNSATIFSASIRLRRLRTICPSAGSFMSQVNHKPKHYNRCVSHTHTLFGLFLDPGRFWRVVYKVRSIIGEHSVDGIRNGGDQRSQKVGRDSSRGAFVELGKCEFAGPVDSNEEIELTLFGSHLRNIDMKVADGVLPKLLPGWLVAFHIGQPADAVPLKTPVQRRAGQLRNRGLERVEAIVQRQQRLLAEGNCYRFLFLGQDSRVRLLRPHRGILDRVPLPPLRNSLRVDPIMAGQFD